ncbi:MAG: cytochrome c [Sphingobacteriales bacterium]|nr:cytochrome c [Sphingobacteriales bacterium]
MPRIIIFLSLFITYAIYSVVVYSKGTMSISSSAFHESEKIRNGKELFQQYNCISCHQLYGLGGYLGPELTTAYSDPQRGELYMKAFLQAGGPRMPNFHFTKEEIDDIISYLKYVDTTAVTYKTRQIQ